DFEELYSRSETHIVENARLRTFGLEDTLFILCFHCVKNRWEQLKHICDISEFVRSQESRLNWECILERAVNTHCKNILFLSLGLAEKVLSAPIPPTLLRSLSSPRMKGTLDGAVRKIVNHGGLVSSSFSKRFRENLAIQDTMNQRIKYLGWALIRRFADITSPLLR
ncbi:MAG: nucleotidyltransferase family protein, partial [Thaumarchaeota archaeon]|nr:nucleotidyltransferase family protein [Nitrososphaerota archaeon]